MSIRFLNQIECELIGELRRILRIFLPRQIRQLEVSIVYVRRKCK